MNEIDAYCERLDASFWAEPINALTNFAFLLAAAYLYTHYRRLNKANFPILWLIVLILCIGVGSFLFHTFANHWSMMADVLPITVFQISYLLIYPWQILSMRWWLIGLLLVAFFFLSYLAGLAPQFANGSIMYLPAILLLLVMSYLHFRSQDNRWALFIPSGIFVISLTSRSIDMQVCENWPIGTHFVWHTLNALLLYLLVKVLIVHQENIVGKK